jgi:hypothetical protein
MPSSDLEKCLAAKKLVRSDRAKTLAKNDLREARNDLIIAISCFHGQLHPHVTPFGIIN